jgi:hypothetical protein
MFLGFDVRPEHGIHTGQVALPIGLKPVHHVTIQAKMNGGFPTRDDDAGAAPEISSQRLGLGCIGTCLVLTLFPHHPDLAKGVSDDGRFLVHLCSLSVR